MSNPKCQLLYDITKLLGHFAHYCFSEYQTTCLSLSGCLLAGTGALGGPDMDGVDNSWFEVGHLIGVVWPYKDLLAGAIRGGVAQHVAVHLRLHLIPRYQRRLFRHLSGQEVSRGIYVYKASCYKRLHTTARSTCRFDRLFGGYQRLC